MRRVGAEEEVQKGLSLLAAIFFSPGKISEAVLILTTGALPFLNHLCFVETRGGGCFSASRPSSVDRKWPW